MNTPIHNFTIKQGETWSPLLRLTLNGTAVNLTDYAAKMEIRDRANGKLIVAPTMTLGGALGTIAPSLTSTQTYALTGKKYTYDLRITKPSPGLEKFFLLEGEVIVKPSSTGA